MAASFVFWRRVTTEASAGDEARAHAANLFRQALIRLAHKHMGGDHMACGMEQQRSPQLGLSEPTPSHLAVPNTLAR